jgi:phage baseplate assembly protein W
MDQNYIKQKTNIQFSDLDLSFIIHPVKKDVVLKTNSEAIKQSLRCLILTNHYERLFHPEIGCNLSKLLFEPMMPIIENYIETEIYTIITNFEPRVKLVSIEVESLYEYNAYNITITYYEQNSTTPVTLNVLLERIR